MQLKAAPVEWVGTAPIRKAMLPRRARHPWRPSHTVIDEERRAFGFDSPLVIDAIAVPEQPPSPAATALAEPGMARVSSRDGGRAAHELAEVTRAI